MTRKLILSLVPELSSITGRFAHRNLSLLHWSQSAAKAVATALITVIVGALRVRILVDLVYLDWLKTSVSSDELRAKDPHYSDLA